MAGIERIVVVTKKTALEELVYRLNSREQARFYLEQNQIPFRDYELEDQQYQLAVASVKRQLPASIKQQFIERDFLATYQFDEHDLIITLGPDGLVINTAKYLTDQPILALNPDPQRVDGVLIPFHYEQTRSCVDRVLQGRGKITHVSMVKAALNDGQVLYAINDLFIGPRSHTSARYRLQLGRQSEAQISSGIIVSTGAGCTGWLRSITQGAWSVASYFGEGSEQPPQIEQLALGWESEKVWFTVREPFVSKISQANLVFGQLQRGQELIITSQMPENGIIFSDGIESDYLAFPSGFIARIGLAERKAHLIARG
ncbi:NAD(+)/NADH kinase [Dictyobacter kobayashii]|uniref:Sugar kinase n=1 Tax=Dictyobacter kobayashii TaxID=2014872 RepID=A0A402ATK2_9CHLR|nr:NAD(+)/NADH kinase [Dictyobacter kobayashii]GCE22438.1 sugar kinase [Dictyobacter kobayashii]